MFLSTLPVVIPFTFVKDITLALRISNAIAIVMSFVTGTMFGRTTGRHPAWVGISMAVVGAILVSATIALGGRATAARRRCRYSDSDINSRLIASGPSLRTLRPSASGRSRDSRPRTRA